GSCRRHPDRPEGLRRPERELRRPGRHRRVAGRPSPRRPGPRPARRTRPLRRGDRRPRAPAGQGEGHGVDPLPVRRDARGRRVPASWLGWALRGRRAAQLHTLPGLLERTRAPRPASGGTTARPGGSDAAGALVRQQPPSGTPERAAGAGESPGGGRRCL
ncbi:MAG: hypothetical protein AVDCRST_MAG53-2955, partial [uncultured Solirubrobacteraceae bacterium]